MTETRKLAAIMAIDVVGYSLLMGEDESGTARAVREHRDATRSLVAGRGGRIVKTMGDGLLLEFPSVVDAVECAIAIQKLMLERNAVTPDGKRIVYRIGVHLGDVLIEGDDILGESVNIAARLEGLCEPGGVLISGSAQEHVRGRIGTGFVDLGEKDLKNIARPLRVYRVAMDEAASTSSPSSNEKIATRLALPEKPSIAVLAFQNMSGDPEQEYFADGITEDVITDLSKVAGLLVIARNSSFAYKGKAVDIRVVARELGVRSVLEGSIRRAGNRVRITAQLIDAETGGHLWADRFDRDLSDIFAVQDEVTRRIVDALKIKLGPGETARLGEFEATSSKAHDFFLAGRELLLGPTRNREMFDRTTDLFSKAIANDPSYSEPYAGLAMAQILNWQFHWTEEWSLSLEMAERHLGLALQKGPQVAFVHYIAAVFFFWNRDLDRSAAEADVALKLNPNYSHAHSMRGLAGIYGEQPLNAVPYIEQAIRLDPVSKQHYLHFLGSAYLLACDYATAAALFRERVQLNPKTDLSRAFLAVALGHLGAAKEARQVWRELAEINPNYSFAEHVSRLPFHSRADSDRLTDGLRKAGIMP